MKYEVAMLGTVTEVSVCGRLFIVQGETGEYFVCKNENGTIDRGEQISGDFGLLGPQEFYNETLGELFEGSAIRGYEDKSAAMDLINAVEEMEL